MRVQTATAWAAAAARDGIDHVIAEAASVEIVELRGAADRPRGPRFGTLVHAVLATVPLDSSEPVVQRTAETQGRLLLASDAEVRAAAVVVIVCAAPRAHRARARRCRDQARVADHLAAERRHDDRRVLDLAFEENGVTVVVDFKTDHELAAGEDRYRAQVQQYVNAVARATGLPATGVLFKV